MVRYRIAAFSRNKMANCILIQLTGRSQARPPELQLSRNRGCFRKAALVASPVEQKGVRRKRHGSQGELSLVPPSTQ
jgi:hypothetical protein